MTLSKDKPMNIKRLKFEPMVSLYSNLTDVEYTIHELIMDSIELSPVIHKDGFYKTGGFAWIEIGGRGFTQKNLVKDFDYMFGLQTVSQYDNVNRRNIINAVKTLPRKLVTNDLKREAYYCVMYEELYGLKSRLRDKRAHNYILKELDSDK